MTSELIISARDYAALQEHLFPGDDDEHAGIILAGVHRASDRLRLLAREVHLLDQQEFIPGDHGYRQFAPATLASLGNRAADEGLALISCHSHPGATSSAALSGDDLAGHRRVFPHLLDIVDGAPVAGIAFGASAAAGEVWTRDATPAELTGVRVIGSDLRLISARPAREHGRAPTRFDRQARMFGDSGQRILAGMRVGVIGVGGGGSMIVEQLAHLGVGSIVAVDFDEVEDHNLSRIVGATFKDASQARTKVDVARDLVGRIDPGIAFEGVDGDLADADIAGRLVTCDFLFLATDTITSRLVANAIAQAYLIPMIQIGAKVDLRESKEIESVYVAVRPVFAERGCLACAGLMDPAALQRESATKEERGAQNYLGLPEVIDPSVITLNGVAASAATNTMLMSAVGLAGDALLDHRLYDARHGSWLALQQRRDPVCMWCSGEARSRFARGDGAELPVRMSVAAEGGRAPAPGRFARLRRLVTRLNRRR